jgi:hypothetical protein
MGKAREESPTLLGSAGRRIGCFTVHIAAGTNVCSLLLLQHTHQKNEGSHVKEVFYILFLSQTSNCDSILI